MPQPGEILVDFAGPFNRRDIFISPGLYLASCALMPGSDGFGYGRRARRGRQWPTARTRVVIDPTLGWSDDPRMSKAGAIEGGPTVVSTPLEATHSLKVSTWHATAPVLLC